MSSSSKWSSLGVQFTQAGLSNAASDAMKYAADAYSEEQRAAAADKLAKAQAQGIQANVRAGQEHARTFGTILPEGFTPIREITALPRLGGWYRLSDGAVPWFYPETMRKMGERMQNKDREKEAAEWFKTYTFALVGASAEQMRRMGDVDESGEFGNQIDLQRAFFWYYRAGLRGDAAARQKALKLKSTVKIEPAAMEDPLYITPGKWKMTIDNVGQGNSTNVFDFMPNGTLTGKIAAIGGPAADLMKNMLAADPSFSSFMQSMMLSATYSGRWAYDKSQLQLKMGVVVTVPNVPGSQSDTWQIELLGQRAVDGALFARDQKMQTYVIEVVESESA